MILNFFAFGFCLAMAFCSFFEGNWITGLVQFGVACLNIPFMFVK